MKTLKKMFLFGTLTTTLLVSQSCKKDQNANPSDQELITTAKITFTDPNGFITDFYWRDLDGSGGNNPLIDTIKVKPSIVYTVKVKILDESTTPSLDRTVEIQSKNTAHYFGFVPSVNLGWQFQITDKDDNNKPLGLAQILATGLTGKGTLQAQLKHEPNKDAPDPLATGESDLDILFPVVVK